MIRYRDLLGDTICSPITPPGYSGVAVIRVSGDKALAATQSILQNKISNPESHRSYLSTILDQQSNKIDQALVTYFQKGKSFTGDETVEISCHGNPLLINAITKCYLEQGCRTAERGEFSFRAYYNGNIDLVQAESIQSLVTAKVKKGSEAFLNQLQGRLSDEFNHLQEQLVTAMAHLEASIDFVEQDIETANYEVVSQIINNAQAAVSKLIKSYDVGKTLSNDLKILIIGNPNAGKSSLFNKLIDKDRAIVTNVAGTTRDLVTEQTYLGNNSVQFIDTAGLRETNDPVESIGIQKTLAEVNDSDAILYIIDSVSPGDLSTLKSLPTDKLIIIFNKMDLLSSERDPASLVHSTLDSEAFDSIDSNICFVSTKTGQGLTDVFDKLENKIYFDDPSAELGLVTQARHFNHLCELNTYLSTALTLTSSQESPDLISQELLLALTEVHQLLGKEYNDEVLDKIFSQFCIGK